MRASKLKIGYGSIGQVGAYHPPSGKLKAQTNLHIVRSSCHAEIKAVIIQESDNVMIKVYH